MNQIMRNSGIIRETGAQFRDTVEFGGFKDIVPDEENLIHVNGTTFQAMIEEAFTCPDYNVKKLLCSFLNICVFFLNEWICLF